MVYGLWLQSLKSVLSVDGMERETRDDIDEESKPESHQSCPQQLDIVSTDDVICLQRLPTPLILKTNPHSGGIVPLSSTPEFLDSREGSVEMPVGAMSMVEHILSSPNKTMNRERVQSGWDYFERYYNIYDCRYFSVSMQSSILDSGDNVSEEDFLEMLNELDEDKPRCR